MQHSLRGVLSSPSALENFDHDKISVISPEDECPICRENYFPHASTGCTAIRLPCGHKYGYECLKQWKSTERNRCFFCQKPFTNRSENYIRRTLRWVCGTRWFEYLDGSWAALGVTTGRLPELELRSGLAEDRLGITDGVRLFWYVMKWQIFFHLVAAFAINLPLAYCTLTLKVAAVCAGRVRTFVLPDTIMAAIWKLLSLDVIAFGAVAFVLIFMGVCNRIRLVGLRHAVKSTRFKPGCTEYTIILFIPAPGYGLDELPELDDFLDEEEELEELMEEVTMLRMYGPVLWIWTLYETA